MEDMQPLKNGIQKGTKQVRYAQGLESNASGRGFNTKQGLTGN